MTSTLKISINTDSDQSMTNPCSFLCTDETFNETFSRAGIVELLGFHPVPHCLLTLHFASSSPYYVSGMVSMLSAVWISCALVVVALAICSATVVATPKSTSAAVALNMLHSSHAPAAIKWRLKRTTAMEATKTSEERTLTFSVPGMESFLDKLKSIGAATDEQSPRNVWWLARTL